MYFAIFVIDCDIPNKEDAGDVGLMCNEFFFTKMWIKNKTKNNWNEWIAPPASEQMYKWEVLCVSIVIWTSFLALEH